MCQPCKRRNSHCILRVRLQQPSFFVLLDKFERMNTTLQKVASKVSQLKEQLPVKAVDRMSLYTKYVLHSKKFWRTFSVELLEQFVLGKSYISVGFSHKASKDLECSTWAIWTAYVSSWACFEIRKEINIRNKPHRLGWGWINQDRFIELRFNKIIELKENNRT